MGPRRSADPRHPCRSVLSARQRRSDVEMQCEVSPFVLPHVGRCCVSDSDLRAERLLGQLQQWAMEAIVLPRESRSAFIADVSQQYYEDALKNGLSAGQAQAWQSNIDEWLHALVEV